MIAGMMAIDGRFPLWRECLTSLTCQCDKVVILLDLRGLDESKMSASQITKDAHNIANDCGIHVVSEYYHWNRWNWREALLLYVNQFTPEIVLCPDQDEQYTDGLEDDLDRLRDSDHSGLMFRYHAPLPTMDGSDPCEGAPYPTYPGMPHMKAFKWRKGLSYAKYTGFARITNYSAPEHHLAAQSEIMHYCCWTPEMRAGKDFKW